MERRAGAVDGDGLAVEAEQRQFRYNRALMDVGRRLWREDLDFHAALSAIAEAGARVLDVERVNVWRFDPDGMRCLHGVERADGELRHNPPGFDELLRIDNTAYAAALPTTRVIRADDVAEAAVTSEPRSPLTDYFGRHRIQSVLDTPVRVEEGMFGVICHEHVGDAREWTPDEIAFAGNMGDFVALAVEIDRRKAAEARLDFLAFNDPVSGRANRRFFLLALKRELQCMERRPRMSAVLFIDIDRFGALNSATGEAIGDAVLGAIGARLQVLLPDSAVIARVESDCFGVLLPALAHEWQATTLASDVLHAVVDAHRDAGVQDGGELSASIGIAFANGDRPQSADAWLADADAASDHAKSRGRGRYEVFDPEHHQGLLERLLVETRLREALRTGSFEVHYQPEIDLDSGCVIAAEALLRWRDGNCMRAAGEFIDVAEESGLIVPIGRWVLTEACQRAAGWGPCAGNGPPMVRVNLSARQFEQPGLVDMVADALANSGLAAARLCLEITETTLMTRAEAALETLTQLRTLGVSLAIDDFGTGYSSLAYLKRFPVDTVKIDRSFVEGLPGDRFDLAIVQAVLGLARTLGMGIVAEGVERVEQEAVLREHGITRVQGWLYARALDAAALDALMARGGVGGAAA